MLIDIIIFYFVSSELNQTIEPGTVIAHIPTHYQAMNKRVSLPASLSLKLKRQGKAGKGSPTIQLQFQILKHLSERFILIKQVRTFFKMKISSVLKIFHSGKKI